MKKLTYIICSVIISLGIYFGLQDRQIKIIEQAFANKSSIAEELKARAFELYDKDGNKRGLFKTLDNGSTVFAIYDENNKVRLTLFENNGASAIMLYDNKPVTANSYPERINIGLDEKSTRIIMKDQEYKSSATLQTYNKNPSLCLMNDPNNNSVILNAEGRILKLK